MTMPPHQRRLTEGDAKGARLLMQLLGLLAAGIAAAPALDAPDLTAAVVGRALFTTALLWALMALCWRLARVELLASQRLELDDAEHADRRRRASCRRHVSPDDVDPEVPDWRNPR